MTATQAARTAVVVTSHPERDVLDVVIDNPDIDVAVFESPAKAYARIKSVQPAMVIVCLSMDSPTEVLLLTMLKLDHATASIPVWMGAVCCSSSSFRPS